MKLSGIDLNGTIRLTQPNDYMDIEFGLMKNGQSEIKPEFYTLVFFNLMNGNVTGKDGSSFHTGVYFKIKDIAGNVITTPVVKFDWYEGEQVYYVAADAEVSQTISADIRIASVEIYYVANNNDAEDDILIATTNTPAASSFATDDGNGNKGILVAQAGGDLTARVNFIMEISK